MPLEHLSENLAARLPTISDMSDLSTFVVTLLGGSAGGGLVTYVWRRMPYDVVMAELGAI